MHLNTITVYFFAYKHKLNLLNSLCPPEYDNIHGTFKYAASKGTLPKPSFSEGQIINLKLCII